MNGLFPTQLYDKFKKIREIADRELHDHERSFDPGNMRDFVDVYIRQMKEANEEARTKSTFFGEEGRLQFENVISDLLFVSYICETTLNVSNVFVSDCNVSIRLQNIKVNHLLHKYDSYVHSGWLGNIKYLPHVVHSLHDQLPRIPRKGKDRGTEYGRQRHSAIIGGQGETSLCQCPPVGNIPPLVGGPLIL